VPLIYTQTIDEHTQLGVWHITEPEYFFAEKVPLGRSITHPHKRLQHLAGRYILQALVPQFPIHLIQIADTRKPFLENESHHFSISHCGNYAAAIVSTQHRVGIDVETPTDRILTIAHKFFTPKEQALLQAAGLTANPQHATLVWSIKESLFKWYGLGEVDFKAHLKLHSIDAVGNIVHAQIVKPGSIDKLLVVHYQWLPPVWLSFTMG